MNHLLAPFWLRDLMERERESVRAYLSSVLLCVCTTSDMGALVFSGILRCLAQRKGGTLPRIAIDLEGICRVRIFVSPMIALLVLLAKRTLIAIIFEYFRNLSEPPTNK